MIHSRLRGAARRDDVLASIEFVGGGVSPWAKVGALTAGQRRLVEVARAVAGKPRLVLLDEPAAGLPDEETAHLTAVIRAIPEQTGALIILVDHDMALVSAVCDDDGGARLRQADRVGADRGGAAGRARDARLPGHGGGLIPYVIA